MAVHGDRMYSHDTWVVTESNVNYHFFGHTREKSSASDGEIGCVCTVSTYLCPNDDGLEASNG